MLDFKVIKKKLKEEASKKPDDYYPTETLKKNGFVRRRCKCGVYFWTSDLSREVCDEPECSGGYKFIGNGPTQNKMDFIEVWQKFSALFKKFGYTPIKRYPIVARWNETMDFTLASIADFQPYVVSGAVKPPANPLIVPQTCARFTDIENVGVTGRHYTGFVMIGQHAFIPKKEWDQNVFFRDIYKWLVEGVGLNKNEIIFHEDAWAGGGNAGPSMEFFCRGLELGNQVYMQYDYLSGSLKELNLKVCDMGMGQERFSWLTHGTSTSYEANFPTVIKNLYKITGIKPDEEILRKFLPYSGYLNVEEVENIEKTWSFIASEAGVEVKRLKDEVLPLVALYSIGDHTRTLLWTLNDGALPSNTGGGYNLRVLVRRSLDFIYKYGWKMDLGEICGWHASYLKRQYPELMENLNEVGKILMIEKEKYKKTKEKAKSIIEGLRDKEITTEKMIKLYESDGISPEALKQMGLKVEVPADFYNKLEEVHEKGRVEKKIDEKRLEVKGLKETKILYFDDYKKVEFKAKIVKMLSNNIILDETAFYPTSGGQLHDTGTINGLKVKNVFKSHNVVVHELESAKGLKEGMMIEGRIQWERRKQLAQHHTATHIINGAARKILGNHVWQAGAEKTLEKSRLDITHYDNLSKEQIKKIEDKANETVKKKIKVESMILDRDEAEKRFGFRLYQGGDVPGEKLRIIKINDFDVEACGGTHLHNTGEAETIKIIGTNKIQDGIIRIEFVSGKAALASASREDAILREAASILKVSVEEVPGAAEALFRRWKKLRKMSGKLRNAPKGKIYGQTRVSIKNALEEAGKTRIEKLKGKSNKELLTKTAEILRVQSEYVVKTLKRFAEEEKRFEQQLRNLLG